MDSAAMNSARSESPRVRSTGELGRDCHGRHLTIVPVSQSELDASTGRLIPELLGKLEGLGNATAPLEHFRMRHDPDESAQAELEDPIGVITVDSLLEPIAISEWFVASTLASFSAIVESHRGKARDSSFFLLIRRLSYRFVRWMLAGALSGA